MINIKDNTEGWIKLYRQLLDNPIICKDSDYFAVWGYLLLKATHTAYEEIFKGEKITLNPGQLITGRKKISEKFNISESKVQRILKTFKIEQQIEQQTSNKNRLITVLNWSRYQSSEQQNGQQVNNKWTTNEQQVNTYKNVKNEKNDKNNYICCDSLSQPTKKTKTIFIPPSVEDIKKYCQIRNNKIDPEKFIDFYSAKGWMIGKNKMKDWKAAVRTWEKNSNSSKQIDWNNI